MVDSPRLSLRASLLLALGITPFVVVSLVGPGCSSGTQHGGGGHGGTGTGGGGTQDAGTDATVKSDVEANLVPGDFTVRLDQTRGTVTRMIYGHNWLTSAQWAWGTVGRFGGNPTSVHNWRNDFYGTGNDYYFEDLLMTWSNYSTWEQFIEAGTQAGAPMLLVVPTIGWVAQGKKLCVYPYSQYPNQQAYENNCNADAGPTATGCCGNGHVSGSFIDAGIDLSATYTPSTPADVVAWLKAIQTTYGQKAIDNLVIGLDNEPDWWNTTHYDVHPSPTTIDEIWSNNLAYAQAIKAEFPNITIMGPDWVRYWETSNLEKYLQNIADYRKASGVQIIDYLDIHFYPGWGKFSFACSEISDDQRVQGPRLFWDPTYLNPFDGVFNSEAARIVPRYRDLIDKTGAQVKLAITEYNVGSDICGSGAVAQAETLAIFGRYGLDLATRWTGAANSYQAHYALTEGSAAESAFRMFLEHDVTGTSVVVRSRVAGDLDVDGGIVMGADATVPTDGDAGGYGVAQVTAYAVVNGKTINVLLFNKQTVAAPVTVQLGRSDVKTAEAWGFTAESPTLTTLAAPTIDGGLTTISLPPLSATLIAAGIP